MTPRHRRGGPPFESHRDRWIVSYADLVTLLFVFFTTLYAASTMDAAKLTSVSQSLQQAFDTPPPEPTPPGRVVDGQGRGVLGPGRKAIDEQIAIVRTEVEAQLADAIQSGQVEINRDRRGLLISIPETGAFPVGSADLSIEAMRVMSRLSVALERVPNAVRIEGHTDDVPINTARFASNWELSAARAIKVIDVLLKDGAVPPDRLSVAGYGEYRPRTPNVSDAARRRNRRVDIIVLNADTDAAEEPDAGAGDPGAVP
jgi:chemotaxis protein MotB